MLLVIVLQRQLDRLLCEDAAMHLVGRQAIQSLCNRFIGQFHRILERLSLDQLCRHRAGCDRAPTAESLKLHIADYIVIDLEVHLHDVTTLGISDLSDPIRIFDHTDISGIAKVVHYFFAV